MLKKNFEIPPIMWKPTESSGKKLNEFRSYINGKYNVKLENYWDLHKWSVDNLEYFWAEIWDKAGIICSKKYEKVLDSTTKFIDGPEWFLGAKVNYAENLLKYRDDRTALIAVGEDRDTKTITYAEMYKEACKYGASLRKLGLKKNDRVVCYMPNREEPIFAMLGTTSAGAIWSGALPLLGAKAVINRFKGVRPKFLFTMDRFVNDGEEKEMLNNVREIAEGLPSLEKVIIVPSKPESRLKDISFIKNSCFLEEFLSYGENPDGCVPDLVFEQVSVSHPIFINYTSGTTGNPKALVHGFGAILQLIRQFTIEFNVTRDNSWLSMSPVGWVSWNMFCSILVMGGQLVLFEGVPYFLRPTYLWDLVDTHRISTLFLTPSVLDELEKREYYPGEKNHLSSLKTILCGSSVVKPQNYDFVYKKMKLDVMFGSYFGCTEIFGSSMVLVRTLPIYRGEVPAPSLGTKVCCYNDEGKEIFGDLGELVIAAPLPSLPLFIWGDNDRKLYKSTYFKYEDGFSCGDLIMINPVTKGYIAVGRSDDTLKQRGWRFGSSEIYNVVDMFPEVMDSLCVSQYNKHKDERAVLFVKMKDGHQFTNDLERRLRQAIERELTKGHVPDVIVETKDVPKNLNGKKMEIIAKKVINNMPYNDDNLINPESLIHYKDFAEHNKF